MKPYIPFIFSFTLFFFTSTTSYSQFWEEEETSNQEQTQESKEEESFGIWGEAPQDTSKSESSFWDAFKGEPEDSATAARKALIENADTDKKKDQFNNFGKDDFKSDRNNTSIKEYDGNTVMLTGHIRDEKGKPIQENIYLVNEHGKRKLCRANNEGIYKAIIPSGGYYYIHLRNRIVDSPVVVIDKAENYRELSHDFNAVKISKGSTIYSANIFNNNQSNINIPLDTLKTMLNSYDNVSFTIEVSAPVLNKKNAKINEALVKERMKNLESTLTNLGLHKRRYDIKHTTKPEKENENKIVIRIKETSKLQ